MIVKIFKTADRILNILILIAVVIVFLYGAFGLWDTYQIYANAGVDQSLLKYKPQSTVGEDNPTLEELMAINPDTCAWITIDDTNIDYPIVQGRDNAEYLNKGIDGAFSLAGSVFIDYRNKKDFTDFYSLLYAHHMDGGVMFGELPEFLDAKYFEKHQTGTLFLADTTYQIEIFACMHTDAFDTNLFYPIAYQTNEDKEKLFDYIKTNSNQYRELNLTTEDRVIGLSTCYDTTTDGRVFIFGKLVQS